MKSKIKKKKTESVSDKIMKLGKWIKAKTAEQIRNEIKDRLGYKVAMKDLSVYLLLLLRRQVLTREKNKDGEYEYSIAVGGKNEPN
jgi:hypothetical protein